MRPRCPPKTVLCAALVLTLSPSIALGQDPACPSPSDMLYKVKRKETLSEIAVRFYCVNEEPTITHTWEAIYDYNRSIAGKDPHAVPADTPLCLPPHLSGTGWSADRCVERAPSTPPENRSGCGNNLREAFEVCDGADLGGMTCATLGLSPGELHCRIDCMAFDPASCGDGARASMQKASTEPQVSAASTADAGQAKASSERDKVRRDRKRPQKKEALVRRISAELTGGMVVPFSAEMRNHFYRLLGMTGVGARMTLGRIEVAPRALFIGGQHGTIFNNVEQQQQVLGGGLSAQGGIPFRLGPVRFTPGIELGWLYIHREIALAAYPLAGTVEKQSGNIPFVGVFLRQEYAIPSLPRVIIATELGSDLLPVNMSAETWTTNFSAKMLGGLGYAF